MDNTNLNVQNLWDLIYDHYIVHFAYKLFPLCLEVRTMQQSTFWKIKLAKLIPNILLI